MVKPVDTRMEDRMHIHNCQCVPFGFPFQNIFWIRGGCSCCSQDVSGVRFSPCGMATKKAFFDKYPGANEAGLIIQMVCKNVATK